MECAAATPANNMPDLVEIPGAANGSFDDGSAFIHPI